MDHLLFTSLQVQVVGCRPQKLTRFQRIPDKADQTQDKKQMGVFDNPAQCGMEIMQNSPFDVFEFNNQDGRCQGYLNRHGVGLIASAEWDTYVAA